MCTIRLCPPTVYNRRELYSVLHVINWIKQGRIKRLNLITYS